MRKFFRASGISYARAARDLKVNPNTVYNWMDKDDLSVEHVIRISKVYSDVKEYYPEINWSAHSVSGTGLNEEDIQHLSEECRQRLYAWQVKYLGLMSRYTELLERHQKHLEEQLEDSEQQH